MSEIKRKFGARLRNLRCRAGLHQIHLAEKVGVTVESISNIERGVHGPRFDTLEKLAATLKVPLEELFRFD